MHDREVTFSITLAENGESDPARDVSFSSKSLNSGPNKFISGQISGLFVDKVNSY